MRALRGCCVGVARPLRAGKEGGTDKDGEGKDGEGKGGREKHWGVGPREDRAGDGGGVPTE